MAWTVLTHTEVEKWLLDLASTDGKSYLRVRAAIELLADYGSYLGRPLVDTLSHCKIHNLKELRPGSQSRTEVRILFAFDPWRQATLLVAGDKKGEVGSVVSAKHPAGRGTLPRVLDEARGHEMTFVTWKQVRDEFDEKYSVTAEEGGYARREMEAYVTGYRLAELRKRAGITQVQLAKLMGIGQPRVSAIERGDIDSLTVASVRAYVEALGGSVRIVAHVNDTDITLRLPGSAA